MNRRTFLKTAAITTAAAVSPLSISQLALAAGYDRGRAVSYAYQWAGNGQRRRNPAYPSFANNDCTNFASQVIAAGGIPLDGDGWLGTENTLYEWYCRSSWGRTRYSSSWINVNDFRLYHTSNNHRGRVGGIYTAGSANSLRAAAQPGDILQAMNSYAYISGWHSMIVTKKSGGEIYLTYHSGPSDIDQVDVSLGFLLPKVGPSNLFLIQFS